jgi:hypothetical protein
MSPVALLYTDEDMSAMVAILLKAQDLDVTTVPEQGTLGKSDREQLEFAALMNRCLLTHNRVDFERLHLEYMENDNVHSGIIVIPQKTPYEVAQRISVLVNALTADEISNQLLYA